MLVGGDRKKVKCLVSDVFGVAFEAEAARDVMDGKGVFPIPTDILRTAVLAALRHTKNGSDPRPDGIGYRLVKAVKDMRLGRKLVDKIVGNLVAGEIPAQWREMRVVFILKAGRDITLMKSWRPLNLINCMWKLGKKVVAEVIQDHGGDLLYRLQYRSVRRWLAVDILYR